MMTMMILLIMGMNMIILIIKWMVDGDINGQVYDDDQIYVKFHLPMSALQKIA